MNKNSRIARPFTPEEDELLKQVIADIGPHNWIVIASKIPKRTVRQCSERWKQLNSMDKMDKPFSRSEDRLLLEKAKELGKKWTKIALFFEKRSETSLKNRYELLERKKYDKKPKRKMVEIVKPETPISIAESNPFDEFFNNSNFDFFIEKEFNGWWDHSSEHFPIF